MVMATLVPELRSAQEGAVTPGPQRTPAAQTPESPFARDRDDREANVPSADAQVGNVVRVGDRSYVVIEVLPTPLLAAPGGGRCSASGSWKCCPQIRPPCSVARSTRRSDERLLWHRRRRRKPAAVWVGACWRRLPSKTAAAASAR